MLQIDTANRVIVNGKHTGLVAFQRYDKTVVYTPENQNDCQPYVEHEMPSTRYALSCARPASGVPGIEQFELDIMALLERMQR